MEAPSLGNMRRRMTVQAKTEVSDGAGGQTRTWATQATIWAQIDPIRTYEKMIGGQLKTVVTHHITTRFRTDINSSMRILYDGRVFEIQGVAVIDEKRKYLQLACAVGVGS